MFALVREYCPHVEKANLIPIEEFNKIDFYELKCQNCEETKDLWICLFCGKTFCSRYVNSHFIQHNIVNHEHYLCLGIMDLSIWCYNCTSPQNNNVEQDDEDNKGSYIKSEKTDEYIKIYNEFKTKVEEEEKNLNKENVTYNEQYQKDIIEKKDNLCQHIKDITKKQWDKSPFINGLKDFMKIKKEIIFQLLCFSCTDKIHSYEELKNHTSKKHNIFIDLNEITIICMECKRKFNLILIKDKLSIEQKIYIQKILERFPICPKFLTKEEISEIKYHKLISDFSSGKYKKIIFMVGAGISTSAGIPDFRSDNGLFKQLQEKYNLSGPEEFFYLTTFKKNPMFFYEFTKLFDLSQTKPTIAHKFMNFFTKKKYVKYIFTQNIDGLELKAKIPNEKLVFAHGNFLEGHCANCHEDIDIEKINEGINKGEVYYCPKCKGPCKPKIVFYGENLPKRFFESLQDIKDIDLVIIMGTSLKVFPFAGIPEFVEKNKGIIVFNMEKVGTYKYNEIGKEDYFIEGKIDENILKFLEDVKLYDEFENFIKDEYDEELNKIIGEEKEMTSIKDEADDLSKKIGKLNIKENDIKKYYDEDIEAGDSDSDGKKDYDKNNENSDSLDSDDEIEDLK